VPVVDVAVSVVDDVASVAVPVAPEVASVAVPVVDDVASVAVPVVPEVASVAVPVVDVAVSVVDDVASVAVPVVPEVASVAVPVVDDVASVTVLVPVEVVGSWAKALGDRTAKRAPSPTKKAASRRRLACRRSDRLCRPAGTRSPGRLMAYLVNHAVRRYPLTRPQKRKTPHSGVTRIDYPIAVGRGSQTTPSRGLTSETTRRRWVGCTAAGPVHDPLGRPGCA